MSNLKESLSANDEINILNHEKSQIFSNYILSDKELYVTQY